MQLFIGIGSCLRSSHPHIVHTSSSLLTCPCAHHTRAARSSWTCPRARRARAAGSNSLVLELIPALFICFATHSHEHRLHAIDLLTRQASWCVHPPTHLLHHPLRVSKSNSLQLSLQCFVPIGIYEVNLNICDSLL